MNGRMSIVAKIQQIKSLEPYKFIAQVELLVWEYIETSLEIDEREWQPVKNVLNVSHDALLDKFGGDLSMTQTKYAVLCESLVHRLDKEFGVAAESIIEPLRFEINKINWQRLAKLKLIWKPNELVNLLWATILLVSRPRLWLVSTLIFILLFAILYWVTGSLHNADSSCPLGFWDSLFFSMMAVTTGYGDIHPDATGRTLLFFQVAFGFVLLGILISIIVKKIVRY